MFWESFVGVKIYSEKKGFGSELSKLKQTCLKLKIDIFRMEFFEKLLRLLDIESGTNQFIELVKFGRRILNIDPITPVTVDECVGMMVKRVISHKQDSHFSGL